MNGITVLTPTDGPYVERSSDVAMEEHVAVVAEPGGEYATHFTPQSSKAIDQVTDLVSIVCEFDGDIKVLGCDGAAVNTGTAGGVCRLYELIENKPVHWFVCQLHSNELNLREVFKHRDGKTTGPKSFEGQLGKEASGRVHDMPVVQFAPVPGSVPEIPETVFKELSSDQQIVHRLAMGVQSGTIAPQDASRRIGPLNHARWLTLAGRLLRLYMPTESPSSELRDIVRHIVQHYLSMWFCIRQASSCIDEPKNFMRSLELLRKLPQELQNIVQPVIQRNAYWAHPEAVRLSMVADGNPDLRARAVHAIKKCRMQPTDEVRPYILPQINFQAATYAEVFDWDKTKMTEPPLTIGLCDSVIQDIFHTPLKVKNYPVHTQAVERAVQVVTEASCKVAGEAQRHGYICNKLKHRKQIPCVASKRSFVEAFTASQ